MNYVLVLIFVLGIITLVGMNEAFANETPILTINAYLDGGPDGVEAELDFFIDDYTSTLFPPKKYTLPDDDHNINGTTKDGFFTIDVLLIHGRAYDIGGMEIDLNYKWASTTCLVNNVTITHRDYTVPDDVHTIICNEYYVYRFLTPVTPKPTPPPTTTTSPVDTIQEKNNNGGCSDCTAPWLGTDDQGILRVEGGITINGVTKDGGYYYTEYPMINTNIGDENYIVLKFWENQGPTNIEMIQLASVKEVGTSFGESQWMIEVWLDDFKDDMYNPKIGTIKIIDHDGLLSNVYADVWLSQCRYDSVDPLDCMGIGIGFTNDKVPDSPVLVSEARDYSRNVVQNFFNDGLNVVDLDYVEPTASEPYKYECNDLPLDEVMVPTRKNCHFRALTSLWDN